MENAHAERLRAGRVSAGAAVLVLGTKVLAYVLTGSSAIFSDAMESVVNVAAAALLVWSLVVAARPADQDHPYGHGKVEFFTAGLEGSLILAAAVMIAIQAVRQLFTGEAPQQLPLGIAFLVGASVLNGALGVYLVRVGRRTESLALQADGRHVLADVWTSAGVITGLGVVAFTGIAVLDPLIALAVAAWVTREGATLVREAVRGLMDEADLELLDELATALEEERRPEWIDVHGMRAWRSGAEVHADFHLVVPRYFDAERLHAVHETSSGACSRDPPGRRPATSWFTSTRAARSTAHPVRWRTAPCGRSRRPSGRPSRGGSHPRRPRRRAFRGNAALPPRVRPLAGARPPSEPAGSRPSAVAPGSRPGRPSASRSGAPRR